MAGVKSQLNKENSQIDVFEGAQKPNQSKNESSKGPSKKRKYEQFIKKPDKNQNLNEMTQVNQSNTEKLSESKIAASKSF